MSPVIRIPPSPDSLRPARMSWPESTWALTHSTCAGRVSFDDVERPEVGDRQDVEHGRDPNAARRDRCGSVDVGETPMAANAFRYSSVMNERPGVTRLVMYKHGVAYLERSGPADGDFDLSFRRSDMNDVLKSLAVAVARGTAIVGAVAFETPSDPDALLAERNLLLAPGRTLTELLDRGSWPHRGDLRRRRRAPRRGDRRRRDGGRHDGAAATPAASHRGRLDRTRRPRRCAWARPARGVLPRRPGLSDRPLARRQRG